MDAILLTETYVDPRAKTAAEREHHDMLFLSGCDPREPSMTISIYTEATEYGAYTRETVYTPRPSAERKYSWAH